jgi:hypothetical protein
LLLGLLLPKPLSEEEKVGKYGLLEGERGLVGGVSKGDDMRRGMFKVACSYMALYGIEDGGPSSEGGVTHGLHVVQAAVDT